tara:strand:- start:189 stop:482 length:294 start_codon:yes stop_codon:yes gene_type:complete
MEKNQTAMQILIDKMKSELLHLDKNDAKSILLISTIRLADLLLSTEKIQIKKAFNDGEQNVWDRHKNENDFEFSDAQDYFNKTYNNKSETIRNKIEI